MVGSTICTTKRSRTWRRALDVLPVGLELRAVTGADKFSLLVIPVIQAAQVGANFVDRHHALVGVRKPQFHLGDI